MGESAEELYRRWQAAVAPGRTAGDAPGRGLGHVILCPRAHHDLGDLPDELAAELGPLLVCIARAVASVGEIGRVHVCRWGDGSAHFHVWFMARPARVPQVRGAFAAIWDDILPPLPEGRVARQPRRCRGGAQRIVT